MPLELVFAALTGQYDAAFKRMYNPIATAATNAIRDAATEIIQKGRAEIGGAGFSQRWQAGLKAKVTPRDGVSIDAAAHVYHTRGYATIFETGGQISGKPLLWLPLPTLPDRIGGKPMTPKNFVRSIGPLFSIRAPGRSPMLGAYMQGIAGSKVSIAKLRRGRALAKLGVRGRGGLRAAKGVVATPVFVGVSEVTVRKRWNLRQIYSTAEQNLAANFAKRVAEQDR